MKILLVDLQYDYGDAKRGVNTIGEFGFHQALLALGHKVETFYYDDDLGGSPELQARLLRRAEEVRPELIVFCLFRDQFKRETLLKLRDIAPTLNWFGDDTWRFESFSAKYADVFTHIVTTDKFSVSAYRTLGAKSVITSQWAAIDRHEKPRFAGEYQFDVSFVGQFHPYRAWVTGELAKRGLKVACFGHGWPGGSLSSEKMNSLFRHSRINLNIGNSTSLDLGYLTSHWKAIPLALKSRKTRSQIKARNFEIPFFGGFQLTDYVPGIEDYFDIGRELVCYRDIDDAELQIRYFLENESAREAIRLAGEKRASNEGYTERWRKILNQVGSSN